MPEPQAKITGNANRAATSFPLAQQKSAEKLGRLTDSVPLAILLLQSIDYFIH